MICAVINWLISNWVIYSFFTLLVKKVDSEVLQVKYQVNGLW